MREAEATTKSGPGYARHPGYRITFEESPRRVRVSFAGEAIVDARHARLLHETKHIPVYYFHQDEVRMDLFEPTGHHTYCPFKGEASYWTLRVGDRSAENAMWGYPAPYDEVDTIKDYVALYWDKMDNWYEEDEEIFVHARDPYKRIDVIESSRLVKIVLGGETVAESKRARFLFETRLPTRYYLPRDDVRADFLEPSDSHTRCPYKGVASYYHVRVGDQLYEDLVWTYPEPIPECPKIKDYLCFFNEKVDAIYVEGEKIPDVETPWS
jgi:uncharacterized protein (DUF427 family)